MKERPQVAVDLGDAVEVRTGEFNAGHLALREKFSLFDSGEADEVAHCSSPKIAVTRKREPS